MERARRRDSRAGYWTVLRDEFWEEARKNQAAKGVRSGDRAMYPTSVSRAASPHLAVGDEQRLNRGAGQIVGHLPQLKRREPNELLEARSKSAEAGVTQRETDIGDAQRSRQQQPFRRRQPQ